MFSFPYLNTLTWADILFEKLRSETEEWIWKTLFALARYFVATLAYFMLGELTPQLFYQSYLPILASFGVKEFYDMHYVTFLLT